MKRGDVILFKDHFFLVTKVAKSQANIRLIKKDGYVSKNFQKIDANTKVKKIKGAKKRIKIELPIAHVNNIKYQGMIDDAKKCIYNILTNKGNQTDKELLTYNAMRSCMLDINGRNFTLENFCQNIKLKKPDKMYEYIAEKMMKDYKERTTLIYDLSDRGLNKVISNYMTYWKCWHGFNKKLDKALEDDFALYFAEYRRRESDQNFA